MTATRLHLAPAGVLALGLVLGAPTSAHAALTADHVLSQEQVAKVYPSVRAGTMEVEVDAFDLVAPGRSCPEVRVMKTRSTVSASVTNAAANPLVVIQAAEFRTRAAARKYLERHKRYVVRCGRYSPPSSSTRIVVKKAKAPAVGDDRLLFTEAHRSKHSVTRRAAVLVRSGRRVAEVSVHDDRRAVPLKKVRKLGKAAARNLTR